MAAVFTRAVPSSLICTVVPAAAAAACSSSRLFLGMVLQYTLDWVLRLENASAPVALTCGRAHTVQMPVGCGWRGAAMGRCGGVGGVENGQRSHFCLVM